MNIRCQVCQSIFSSDELPDRTPFPSGFECPECGQCLHLTRDGRFIVANSTDDVWAEADGEPQTTDLSELLHAARKVTP